MALTDMLERAADFESTENVLALVSDAFFGDEPVQPTFPIHAAFLHHFENPGGGARAQLTRRCATLLGISEDDGAWLAAAVECLHNASLVQDDLQDKSQSRRGRESVVEKFGIHIALGLTDRLITTAFACLARVSIVSALPGLIRQIHHAVAETVDGQTSELSQEIGESSLDSRLAAAKKKSGPLFALAIELPLILSNQQNHLETAHHGACLFGLGYQILDDLTDQAADAESSSMGNLVLAMKSEIAGEPAQAVAARLARRLLGDAIVQAESLPLGAGRPLIELAEALFPKLDAFDS